MISRQKRQCITGHIRLGLLLLSSLLFYACFGRASSFSAVPASGKSLSGLLAPVCVIFLSGLTWLGGLWIGRSKRPGYPAFFTILLLLGAWLTQKWSGIFLLGISFYSLQAIGYLLDVKNGTYPPEKNPFYILFFLSFFPLSIQGPICRYQDFKKQIRHVIAASSSPDSEASASTRTSESPRCTGGIGRIILGAFKKLVIADRIALMTTAVFSQPDVYQGFYVLLGLFAYTIQLYADFTGGIDITLGLARCLGFSLPENFDHPLKARSLAEYWRRWHITLGSWFRDYVFYPVTLWVAMFLSSHQKNRRKIPIQKLSVWSATLLTWSLTGLWHGLEPRFLLWGLLNGGILLLSQSLEACKKRHVKLPGKEQGLLQMVYVFVLTSLLRSLDCYPDIRTAGRQLCSILTAPFWHSWLGWADWLTNRQAGLTFSEVFFPGLKTADLLLLFVCLAGYWLIRLLLFLVHKKHCTLGETEIAAEKKGVALDFLACRFFQTPSGYWFYHVGCALLLLATLLFGIYGEGYDATGFIYGGFV